MPLSARNSSTNLALKKSNTLFPMTRDNSIDGQSNNGDAIKFSLNRDDSTENLKINLARKINDPNQQNKDKPILQKPPMLHKSDS